MAVYLDYNATAPIRPEAAEAAARGLAIGGNPSSVHAAGRAARAVLEEARSKVAGLVSVSAQNLVFVSGGAEANALAIESAVASGIRRLIVSAAEHDSVLACAKATGADVELWPMRGDGRVKLAWLKERLADGQRSFVALMAGNNETGVIQPVAEAAALVHEAGGWLHVDAIQVAGKIPVNFVMLGADTLSLSAHKIGGPQGVGALAFGPGAVLSRRIHGGGQERGRRAGTENVSGIAGFGAAAEAALRDLPAMALQVDWRDAVEERLIAEAGVTVFGREAPRVPNTLCFAAEGYPAEVQVMAMDLAGVMVSAGAACSSGKVTPSHVLTAMGRADLAASAIRVSGGWATSKADWDQFADAWLSAYARHQARRKEFA